ncbi:MAG: hypothetical protein PHS96_08320 [Anaerolineales bacterium]|nr:hypothetical protein [Anaerolineales bacterium]
MDARIARGHPKARLVQAEIYLQLEDTQAARSILEELAQYASQPTWIPGQAQAWLETIGT